MVVVAERADLIGEQFAALAQEMGSVPLGAPLAAVQRAVLMSLREQRHWLLVLDNAEEPRDITDWLPGGTGHVLITSRAHGWHEVALPVDVSVLDRRESVEMLHRRVSSLPEADADEVAEAAGDLPLAVAQAAGSDRKRHQR